MLFALIALEKFAQTSKYQPSAALNSNITASAACGCHLLHQVTFLVSKKDWNDTKCGREILVHLEAGGNIYCVSATPQNPWAICRSSVRSSSVGKEPYKVLWHEAVVTEINVYPRDSEQQWLGACRQEKHLLLEWHPHPQSPQSFAGTQCFSTSNGIIKSYNRKPLLLGGGEICIKMENSHCLIVFGLTLCRQLLYLIARLVWEWNLMLGCKVGMLGCFFAVVFCSYCVCAVLLLYLNVLLVYRSFSLFFLLSNCRWK